MLHFDLLPTAGTIYHGRLIQSVVNTADGGIIQYHVVAQAFQMLMTTRMTGQYLGAVVPVDRFCAESSQSELLI